MNTLSPVRPFSPARCNRVTFQGKKTTELARKEIIPFNRLAEHLRKDTDPYLGGVPPALTLSGKYKERDILRGLDWLAIQLSNRSHSTLLNLCPHSFENPVKKMIGAGQLKVRVLGDGRAGKVYELEVGGQSFAFKVFREMLGNFNPYREAATGMFFTARRTKDLSALYTANPVKGWTLMEHIDKGARLDARSGKTLLEQGYKLSDEHAKNRINNIRVDHGGRVTKIGEGYISGDRFVPFSPKPEPTQTSGDRFQRASSPSECQSLAL